ncbi:MAG: WXG100 family type VII secretion target [Lachnospiraceae bacterium]|nr:WXG100 family type VII secretion target [Lachnospiraceae bacterium]
MGEGTISVKPEELVVKASELQRKVSSIREKFSTMTSLVEKTESYWLGEAGSFYREMYQDAIKEQESVLKRLEEHPKDLLEIAQRYSDKELHLEQLANELPGDVLV